MLRRWTTFGCLATLYFLLSQLRRQGEPFTIQEPTNEWAQLRQSNTSLFICAIFWNSAEILPRWSAEVLRLAHALGTEKVFVSIYESGSWDDSKDLLRGFDQELDGAGVDHHIELEPATHADSIPDTPAGDGWVRTPQGEWELRRIPYLAQARNRALAPLHDQPKDRFTHTLFLNVVAFTPKDLAALLSTNDGVFVPACALDFAKPPAFYDTFALRDAEGHEHLQAAWPYFRARSSRNALQNEEPVPVRSCWNGMVVMDAGPFYHNNLSFRALPDSMAQERLEASECCLIHFDNPLSSTRGVFVHPTVRVAYSEEVYNEVSQPGWPASRTRKSWRSFILRLWPAWTQKWSVERRLRAWRRQHPGEEIVGEDCVISEMQVLRANGWAHIDER